VEQAAREAVADKLRILAQSDEASAGRRRIARIGAAAAMMALGVVAAFGLAPDASLDTARGE
jgi:hypothetical protein